MRYLLTISLMTLTVVFLNAQTFAEAKRQMSKGTKNSYVLDFQIGEADDIEDLWLDYQRDYDADKPKQARKSDEYFANDAEIGSISANTIDIYSTVEDKGKAEGAVITVWFDLGGAYLSSEQHPERVGAARDWLQQFRQRVLRTYAKEALERERDQLEDMRDELKDLRKERDDAAEEVEELQEELAEARKKVDSTTKKIAEQERVVEQQQAVVERNQSKVDELRN